VGKERKVVVGLGGVVLLALLAFMMAGALFAVVVLVLGLVAGVVILRREALTPTRRRPGKGRSKGGSPLDLIGSAPTTPASAASLLPTWTPPTDAGDAETSYEPDPAPTTSWDDGQSWTEGSTWSSDSISTETNPLDDLDRLDDVDVVAEVERLEARSGLMDETTTSFDAPFDTSFETSFETSFDAPVSDTSFDTYQPIGDQVGAAPVSYERFEPSFVPPINEEVSSPDDIMAASQATELSIATAADDNSELAKLLAKVQQRLAAYE
jgi:hypothetical protein